MSQAIPLVGCSAGCGGRVPEDKLEDLSWTYLAVSQRWRCPQCTRELSTIGRDPQPTTPQEQS